MSVNTILLTVILKSLIWRNKKLHISPYHFCNTYVHQNFVSSWASKADFFFLLSKFNCNPRIVFHHNPVQLNFGVPYCLFNPLTCLASFDTQFVTPGYCFSYMWPPHLWTTDFLFFFFLWTFMTSSVNLFSFILY